MSYVKIRPRRGSSQQWEYANPILAEGEMAFEVPDTGVGTGAINIKQGDGQTAWVNLPYAFNAANLNNKVDELANTVATYDATITNLSNAVASMEEQVQHIRKIDIQSTEPSTDLVLGQIWINTDMVTGSMVLSPSTVALEVGTNTRLTLTNTLSSFDSIQWTSSDELLVSISNTSNTGCTITGNLEATNVRITAKALLNGNVIYTATSTVTVSVSGGIVINPDSQRIVIGNSKRFSLVNSLTNYDSIQWTSSAPYYAEVTTYANEYADIQGILSGSATVYARALLNGSYIATAQAIVTIVGMALNKTTANIGIGESTNFALSNTMIEGTDYDTITWASSGDNVAMISASSNTSATVVGVSAGQCYITAAASLDGIIVQQVQAIVGVTGALTLDQTSKSMDVGEIGGLICTNTLGVGNYDTIRWTSSDETIVRINSSTDSNAVIEARAAGYGVITVTAYLNGAYVTSASCTVVSNGRISMDETTKNVTVGSTVTLTCTNTLSSSQYAEVRWTTNASDVCAIVTRSATECQIEGRAAGTAIITVLAVDAEGATVSSDTCTVTVAE